MVVHLLIDTAGAPADEDDAMRAHFPMSFGISIDAYGNSKTLNKIYAVLSCLECRQYSFRIATYTYTGKVVAKPEDNSKGFSSPSTPCQTTLAFAFPFLYLRPVFANSNFSRSAFTSLLSTEVLEQASRKRKLALM